MSDENQHRTVAIRTPILQVTDARKTYHSRRSEPVHAVRGVSLTVEEGTSVGLVGESGCGKSTLMRGILQLDAFDVGKVLFEGVDLTTISAKQLRTVRTRLQVVLQDPYSSMNPRMSVGEIVAEPLMIHQRHHGRNAIRQRVVALLDRVGLPASVFDRYPHEFSGGQRQRVSIARAIALEPRMLLCDEPVSALDVSVQAQVLELLDELQRTLGLSILFVSHDMAVVRQMTERIYVMHGGQIVEEGDTETVFTSPQQPYTKELLTAVPGGFLHFE